MYNIISVILCFVTISLTNTIIIDDEDLSDQIIVEWKRLNSIYNDILAFIDGMENMDQIYIDEYLEEMRKFASDYEKLNLKVPRREICQDDEMVL